MDTTIPTRFLLLSDTHGQGLGHPINEPVDVVVHSGDITQESKLSEYKQIIAALKAIDAPLKLVIAGNHDFTLDIPVYQEKLREAGLKPPEHDEQVKKAYGAFGDARSLFECERQAGIRLLDEGIHVFELKNGAVLRVFASPFTPSKDGGWAYCYDPNAGHKWDIAKETDVVITHTPPRGILDFTPLNKRLGSTTLFAAVAKSRPKLHCFGHVHEAWGAKTVTWKNEQCSANPSHFTEIDNENSEVIENLSKLERRNLDSEDVAAAKATKRAAYERQGYCYAQPKIETGKQTLFVNAAIEICGSRERQLPWIVSLNLRQRKDCEMVQIDEDEKVET